MFGPLQSIKVRVYIIGLTTRHKWKNNLTFSDLDLTDKPYGEYVYNDLS